MAFLTSFNTIFDKMLTFLRFKFEELNFRPNSDASGGRTRPHGDGGVLGGQVQGLGLRQDQGRKHPHAHRGPQRTPGHGHGSLQERSPPADAK